MSNQVVLIKPNSRDDFEKMEMKDYTSQFMYQNDNELVFMNTKTFEEYSVPSQLVDSNLLKLLEGTCYLDTICPYFDAFSKVGHLLKSA